MRERLQEIGAAPSGATEAVFRWITAETFNLKLRIEVWIADG